MSSTSSIPDLREAVAKDVGEQRKLKLTADNVSIQPGGKPTIGKFIMTAMNPGDKVLYPNPGYPIYASQIEFHGGAGLPYGYKEARDGFILDMDIIRKGVQAGAKILIYNNYQNPTGASSPPEEMEELASLAVKNDLFVLSDEAYFEIRYIGKPMSIASFPGMAERTVILYTFSKKFAMESLYEADDFIEEHRIPELLIDSINTLKGQEPGKKEPGEEKEQKVEEKVVMPSGEPAAEKPSLKPEPSVAPPVQPPKPTSEETIERAKRLARTIVSDIYLYNTPKAEAAIRSNRFHADFASELKEGLKLYENRITLEVRAKGDFFQDTIRDFIEKKKKSL